MWEGGRNRHSYRFRHCYSDSRVGTPFLIRNQIYLSFSLSISLKSTLYSPSPPPSSLPPRPIPCIYRSNKKPIPLNWVPGLIRQPLGRLIWINGNLVHRLRIDRTYPLLVISGSKQTTYNRRNICIKEIYKYGRNRCVGVCIDNAKLFILWDNPTALTDLERNFQWISKNKAPGSKSRLVRRVAESG